MVSKTEDAGSIPASAVKCSVARVAIGADCKSVAKAISGASPLLNSRVHSLMVRTPPCHGGDASSILAVLVHGWSKDSCLGAGGASPLPSSVSVV